MTIKQDQHGLTVQAARPALSQNIAVGAGSVVSLPFSAGPVMNVYRADGTPSTQANNTTHIRVCSTANCWISFGSNPVAVVGSAAAILIPALTPEYFWVVRGERLAVIQDSGAGTLNIAELAQ